MGTADNALDTNVDAISLDLGAGGGYLSEANGLVVSGEGIFSAGNLSLVSQSGDLQLDADVQLNGDANLALQAVLGAVTQAASSTISTAAGDVAIQGYTGASVARVSSESGLIDVLVTDGPFVLPSDSTGVNYGDQAVRIQGADIQIDAPMAGSGSIEFTVPSQAANLSDLAVDTAQLVLTVDDLDDLLSTLPIVIGDTQGLATGAPVQGVDGGLFIDVDELAQISDGFDRILIGSQDPRQFIWLNAPTLNGVAQSLVFRDPLVLVASGVALDADGNKLAAGGVRISGSIEGQGLEIWGSGSTTELDAAQLRQAGDVLISDSLIVHSDSHIEVTSSNGVLDIRGSILVKRGATLSLSASQIRLGAFVEGSGELVLEAGATLVLGTQRLSVDSDLVINGGGAGQLVLQGSLQGGVVQDFVLSAEDLQTLTTQMTDGTFGSIVVGHSTADTTVMSPSLWSEGAGSVSLAGTTVHLGEAGGNSSWQIGRHTSFDAVGGDLVLNADLISSNGSYLSLRSDGQVRMASDARIETDGGLVTLNAVRGIEVGFINASGSSSGDLRGAVAMDSAQGQIVLAATSNGEMGIRAQSVSLYGYGQLIGGVTADDRVLRVETDRLQVAAPTGVAARGMNAEGLYYRLTDRDATYVQAQVVGDSPERVMVPRVDVAGQSTESAAFVAYGASTSAGFTSRVQAMALAGSSRMAGQDLSMQVQAYLSSYVRPMLAGLSSAQAREQDWISLDTDGFDDLGDDLLLSDLAYGFPERDDASFVLGLPAVQPISAGLTASSDVLFDYAAE